MYLHDPRLSYSELPTLTGVRLGEEPLIVPTLPAPEDEEDDGDEEDPPPDPAPSPTPDRLRSPRRRRFPPWTFLGLFSLALALPGALVGEEAAPLPVCPPFAAEGIVGGGRVHTPQGLTSAGAIRPGDWVLAGDPAQAGLGYDQVVGVCRREVVGAVRLFLGDEAGLQDVVVLGPGQRLWIYGQGWLKVGALSAGMRVRTADGAWILLLGHEPVGSPRELVHLTLASRAALVVGLDGIFSQGGGEGPSATSL